MTDRFWWLLLLAVVGVALWWSWRRGWASWSGAGQPTVDPKMQSAAGQPVSPYAHEFVAASALRL